MIAATIVLEQKNDVKGKSDRKLRRSLVSNLRGSPAKTEDERERVSGFSNNFPRRKGFVAGDSGFINLDGLMTNATCTCFNAFYDTTGDRGLTNQVPSSF